MTWQPPKGTPDSELRESLKERRRLLKIINGIGKHEPRISECAGLQYPNPEELDNEAIKKVLTALVNATFR